MSEKKPINLEASVRRRLLNVSRERDEDFNLVLTRYATERFLYRLSMSPYTDQFVLKGALLSSVNHSRGPSKVIVADHTADRCVAEECLSPDQGY